MITSLTRLHCYVTKLLFNFNGEIEFLNDETEATVKTEDYMFHSLRQATRTLRAYKNIVRAVNEDITSLQKYRHSG